MSGNQKKSIEEKSTLFQSGNFWKMRQIVNVCCLQSLANYALAKKKENFRAKKIKFITTVDVH